MVLVSSPLPFEAFAQVMIPFASYPSEKFADAVPPGVVYETVRDTVPGTTVAKDTLQCQVSASK